MSQKKGMSYRELIALFRTNTGCTWGVHLMHEDKEINDYIFRGMNKSSNWAIRWNGQREGNDFYKKVECVIFLNEKPFIPKNGYYGKNVVIMVPKGGFEFDWYCYIKHQGKWVSCSDKSRIQNYLRTTRFLAFTCSKEMVPYFNIVFWAQKELRLFKPQKDVDKWKDYKGPEKK